MTIAPGRVTIPYLDLSVKDAAHKEDLLAAVERVLSHGRIVLGPEVEALERRLAAACGRRHGVGVNSGTDAVYLALRALGVGPGDEVVTTALSWIATANAVALCGATPVFADVAPDLNVDPDAMDRAITPRTKALLPVHYTGLMCDMRRLREISERRGVPLVEDAAQAYGASRDGLRAGECGRLSCFSMNAMKVLCSYGEAGAVLTDDETLRERLTILRYNGTVNKEECLVPSHNGRLDTLQAAMLLVNLGRLPAKIEARRRIARRYNERLAGLVETPREPAGGVHVFYTYMIQTDRRDALKAHLAELGIETKVHHPIVMARQKAYAHLPQSPLPAAERAVTRILSLPNHENLSDAQVDTIADAVRRFHGAA